MSILSAEISATCNALGYFDENTDKYYADSNTLETVKDLIRYLRRDDQIHTIRRQLGQTKVLQTDLLPLLKSYHQENDLFDVLLRLIMNLTTPPLLLYNSEIPTNVIDRNYYLEMEDHLKSYKEAFVDDRIWAVFSTYFSKILDIDHAHRDEESGVKIERVLVLIRNILFVPADEAEKRPDNDASIHDQVLWALHHSGLLDIILYITTNPVEQQYYMHILEIMYFMLREQKPDELANAALERSQREKVRDEAELINLRNKEINNIKKSKYSNTRHSRFGGTYVITSMKSISDNNMIYHKGLNKLDKLDFDLGKNKQLAPRNRLPIISNETHRRSAFTIRLFLKEFCIEFLNGSYNTVMRYVKSMLVRNSEAHDESYYFWTVKFFMAFNRRYKFDISLISETLSTETFHYVQKQAEDYFDLMKTNKKSMLLWSRRLHLALLAYKELLLTLFLMDKSTDKVLKDSSKVIKMNVFYVPEYREFILNLLIMFDELKMSNVYLKDLMETQHLFVKMFEEFCKVEGGLLVQKKAVKKRKKHKSKVASQLVPPEEILNKTWDTISPQISALLESGGEFLTDVVPFDAASDTPIDEQKIDAMKKIQTKLRSYELETALGLLRSAREIWPEHNFFGNSNMTKEEEFLGIQEIFFSKLSDENNIPTTVDNNNEGSEDENDDDDDDDDGNTVVNRPEVRYNFDDFVKKLAHPKIVRACGIALRTFNENTVNTNNAIIKLLHRIAFDCKMYVMLFQLSIFHTFEQIYEKKNLPEYKELVKFATYIMRQFYKVLQGNDKLFVEVLFWKNSSVAYDIENGYLSNAKDEKGAWTEEEEGELYQLFKEHRNQNIDEDVVDWICRNLINTNRTRRKVLKKLRDMDLLVDDYKRRKTNKSEVIWTEDEIISLTELYEEYKSSSNPLNLIINNMEKKRTKAQVIDKLLELSLIRSKKDLQRKSSNNKSNIDHDFDDSEESEIDMPVSTPTVPKRQYTINNDITEVTKVFNDNVNSGNRSALEWLKESFADAIEDFEENNEAIPLVPITEETESALESSEFQTLLKSIGVTEPFDEQESYWRIPEGITLEELKTSYNLITTLLDGDDPPHKRSRLED